MGMKAIVFDADGTLVLPTHRLHHLEKEPKDWAAFHDALVDDPPIEATVWINQMLFRASQGLSGSDEYAVLIASARHEPYRAKSEQRFRELGVMYDKLYMRADADRRPDHEVKADILMQMAEDGYDVVAVFDDRPDVCDMWRSFGITVYQCEYTDIQSKYAGKVMLTLLIGPAGAGKSTYAKANYRAGEIISSDRIREEEGLGHTQDDLAATFKLARGYTKGRIEAGFRAVIDATNLKKKDRMAFVRLVPKGALIEYVVICRDYDEMVTDRGWRPVELIDKHYRLFNRELGDIKAGDNLPHVIVKDARRKR